MPKFKKIPFKKAPLEIFSKLYNHYQNTYMLESIEGPKKLSQYSFIGFNPKVSIITKNGEAIISNEKTGEREREKTTEPLKIIAKTMKYQSSFKKQRFVGGAVGYVAYDAIKYWEKIPEKSIDDQKFPDINFGIFDDGIIYDHRNMKAFYYYLNENRLEEIRSVLKEKEYNEKLIHKQLEVNISKERFKEAVNKAKEYIYAGDIFQVVLS
ncbi:MAG: hypothetical protein P8Y18_05845, partial [Candidatus Bathyarchaeota archaeon]